MSIQNYWPSTRNIDECIKTNAEDLPEYLLLAVHEPMVIEHITDAGEQYERNENDLLKEFLEYQRPIPIIGTNGIGKSHLIRWLHAKLRVHEKSDDWHIVRIRKNSSLRKALEDMLQGLEGDKFDEIRARLETVSQEKTKEQMQAFLITQMRLELLKMGKNPEALEGMEANLSKWCLPEKLPALVNDGYYSDSCLLAPFGVIRNIADSIFSGHDLERTELSDIQFSQDSVNPNQVDFDFRGLGVHAFAFFKGKQLNTSEGNRKKVANLLNLATHRASQWLVGEFFQLGAGGFGEIFTLIREKLFEENKKLCVLVEDLTAVSAIEQVLIDCMMVEADPDGVQTMCELRSAFAVTDGYQGYLRRRGAIVDRSNGEWRLSDHVTDEGDFSNRIERFIGRYLNAARFGLEALQKMGNQDQVWKDQDTDPDDLSVFGFTQPSGIPLFPYNRPAINFLADKYCRATPNSPFRFIPRDIIRDILRAILKPYRANFETSNFPTRGFLGASSDPDLQDELRRVIGDVWQRADATIAIWGGDSNCHSINDLQDHLAARIPRIFGLETLADLLSDTIPIPPPPVKTNSRKKEQKEPLRTKSDPLSDLEKTLRAWGSKGGDKLPQDVSSNLRNELEQLIQINVRKDWYGLKDQRIEIPKNQTQLSIHIPKAVGRIPQNKRAIRLCSDKEFTDPDRQVALKRVVKALLRNGHYRNTENNPYDWAYDGGIEDQAIVFNFAAVWVPKVAKQLFDLERGSLNETLEKHWVAGLNLGVLAPSGTTKDKLLILLKSSAEVSKELPPPFSENLRMIREEAIKGWDDQRGKWLNLVAPSRRAIDFRLIKKTIASCKNIINVSRQYRVVFNELDDTISTIDHFKGENTTESISELFLEMVNVTGVIEKNDLWPPETGMTATDFVNRVNNMLEDSAVPLTIRMLVGFNDFDDFKKVRVVNKISDDVMQNIVLAVKTWIFVVDKVFTHISQNPTPESENIDETVKKINDLIGRATKTNSNIEAALRYGNE